MMPSEVYIHSHLELSSSYLAITPIEYGVDLLGSQCEQISSFLLRRSWKCLNAELFNFPVANLKSAVFLFPAFNDIHDISITFVRVANRNRILGTVFVFFD